MAFGGSSFAAPMFAGGGMPPSLFGTGTIEDYQTNGIQSAVLNLAGTYGTATTHAAAGGTTLTEQEINASTSEDYVTAGGTIIDRRSQ